MAALERSCLENRAKAIKSPSHPLDQKKEKKKEKKKKDVSLVPILYLDVSTPFSFFSNTKDTRNTHIKTS